MKHPNPPAGRSSPSEPHLGVIFLPLLLSVICVCIWAAYSNSMMVQRKIIDAKIADINKQNEAKNELWAKCVAEGGTPVLGFEFRLVCLDPQSVKILDQE